MLGVTTSALSNSYPLCSGIQSGSGFIQEKDLGVPHESSGNGNALLLSS